MLNLDNCFLNSARVQPPRCNLTFFPDQGVEIVKESILHSGAYSGLIDILYSGQYVQAGVRTNTEGGRDACGNPALPTKPCRVTNLVGKAYAEAGQAGESMQTMVVLQAYQMNLLKQLDQGEGLGPEAVQEHSKQMT